MCEMYNKKVTNKKSHTRKKKKRKKENSPLFNLSKRKKMFQEKMNPDSGNSFHTSKIATVLFKMTWWPVGRMVLLHVIILFTIRPHGSAVLTRMRLITFTLR